MSKKINNKIFVVAAAVCFLLLIMYTHSRGHREHLIDIDMLNWNGGYQEGDHYVIDEKNEKGVICYTNLMELNPGDYVIRLHYEQQFVENKIRVRYGSEFVEVSLPLDAAVCEVPLTVREDTRQVRVEIDYEQTGKFVIYGIEVIGRQILFTDMYFFMVLTVLCAAAFLIADQKGFFDVSAQKKLAWAILWGAVLVASLPLLGNGLIDGADLDWHLARIDGIRDALTTGQFPARISPYEYNGYGMLQTMYPNGFLYFPALLRLLGVSALTAYKTLIVLINIATGLAVYYTVNLIGKGSKLCRDEERKGADKLAWCGAVAAALYCLMPYRLINIYSRGALGEVLAMVFLPLLFLALFHLLIGDQKKWYWLSIAVTGMIQTHIISFMLCILICIGVCVIWFKRFFSDGRYLCAGKAALLTAALNAVYLVPFLYFYLGKFTGAEEIKSVSGYLEVNELFLTGYDGFAVPMFGTVGLACAIFIFMGFLYYDRGKNELYRFFQTLAVFGAAGLLLATELTPYKQLLKLTPYRVIMESLQFPWRLLGITAAAAALLTGCFLAADKKLYQFRCSLAIGLLAVAVTAAIPCVSEPTIYLMDEITRDSYRDYVPTNAVAAETDISDTTLRLSDEGAVSLTDYRRAGRDITFTYTSDADGQYVDIPVFYYPGCFAAKDGSGRALSMEESPEGRIRLHLNQAVEPLSVRVSYQDAPMFVIALWISIVTALFVVIRLVYKRKKIRAIQN